LLKCFHKVKFFSSFTIVYESTAKVRKYNSRSETRLWQYLKGHFNRTLVGTLPALYRYFRKTLTDI